MELRTSGPALKVCAWTGPVFVVGFLIGFIPLAHFGPPPRPTASAAEITEMYLGNLTGIRIGCLVMMISLAFIATWGVSIAAWTRRMERGVPILTYGSIACIGGAIVIVELIPMTWAAAAFRPDEVAVDTTRAFNDFAWFLFLFTWPPFSIWCALIAAAVFTDRNEVPVFPRWVGYFNVWAALLFVPGGLMAFFKTGPFAFNGAVTFYIPLSVFLIWMIVMTWAVLRAGKHDEPAAQRAAAVSQPVG
jgi:hypothetical protein